MRAMPSPTDSTVPTSETSASASKFAIWSRMTREISAARISIQLAFHRLSESVEFGADRCVDALAAQLHDDSAEDGGIDLGVDVDIAAGAGAELRLEFGDLIVVERPRGHDFGDGFTAMLRSEAAEGSDDRAKLVPAAVLGEHAEEVRGDRIDAQLGCDGAECLGRLVARDERAFDQLRKILRIDQRLAQRLKTAADCIDLPLVACQI